MSSLRYFTLRTVEELRATVADRLDWYYEPSERLSIGGTGAFRESRLQDPELASRLEIDDGKPSNSDVDNALAAYEALRLITPHQASIERLWVYLSHCDCPQYVAFRWLKQRPQRKDEAIRKVQNHFFARGNRGLIRDNGVARLWWLGKIAHDVDPLDPRRFLAMLLYRQDTRSALIERPSISMNREVLKCIYRVMADSWEGDRQLFERQAFRRWMIALNRRGGVILMDSVGGEELVDLLRGEAQKAVADGQ